VLLLASIWEILAAQLEVLVARAQLPDCFWWRPASPSWFARGGLAS